MYSILDKFIDKILSGFGTFKRSKITLENVI